MKSRKRIIECEGDLFTDQVEKKQVMFHRRRRALFNF
jgi:hypothetical protein